LETREEREVESGLARRRSRRETQALRARDDAGQRRRLSWTKAGRCPWQSSPSAAPRVPRPRGPTSSPRSPGHPPQGAHLGLDVLAGPDHSPDRGLFLEPPGASTPTSAPLNQSLLRGPPDRSPRTWQRVSGPP
jgi:hypothetical protein